MPKSHEPSLRVPSPRLPQARNLKPQAGDLLPPAADLPADILRAALSPFQFVFGQLWLGVSPLADLLGLPTFGRAAARGAAPDDAPGEC